MAVVATGFDQSEEKTVIDDGQMKGKHLQQLRQKFYEETSHIQQEFPTVEPPQQMPEVVVSDEVYEPDVPLTSDPISHLKNLWERLRKFVNEG